MRRIKLKYEVTVIMDVDRSATVDMIESWGEQILMRGNLPIDDPQRSPWIDSAYRDVELKHAEFLPFQKVERP